MFYEEHLLTLVVLQIICAPVEASCAAGFPDYIVTSAQVREVYAECTPLNINMPTPPPPSTNAANLTSIQGEYHEHLGS